jgi:hypothetical protein
MPEMIEVTQTICPTCSIHYPTIIHTCQVCSKIIATSRGFKSEVYEAPYSLCNECWKEMAEKSWKYEELCK